MAAPLDVVAFRSRHLFFGSIARYSNLAGNILDTSNHFPDGRRIFTLSEPAFNSVLADPSWDSPDARKHRLETSTNLVDWAGTTAPRELGRRSRLHGLSRYLQTIRRTVFTSLLSRVGSASSG